MNSSAIFAALLCACAVHAADARLVSVRGGDHVLDTGTGMQWLHLDRTQGMSYLELVASTGDEGSFEDYRLATLDDLHTLFANAGIAQRDAPQAWSQQSMQGASTLTGMFGEYLTSPRIGSVAGFFDHGGVAPPIMSVIWILPIPGSGLAPHGSFANDSRAPSVAEMNPERHPTIGGWLVFDRGHGHPSGVPVSPAPEPSTWALMLVGCLAVAGYVRRCATHAGRSTG